MLQAQPAQTVNLKLSPTIAREAAWLRQAGWPLYALVDRFATNAPLDEQTNCLATAVYFEARGEAVEGQLAVARVVMNRAASGKYPPSWCEVVKQPAQFSFVRHGSSRGDTDCDAWPRPRRCPARRRQFVPSLSHRRAVVPCQLRGAVVGPPPELRRKIGQHIFYRA